MGLLDNIFPGGNPPFQPFISVAAIANNLTSMVDNPGYSLNSTVAPALTVTTLNKNLRAPIRYNWNIAVQRETFFRTMLTVAYVGGRGIHNWRVFDINQPTVGAQQANPGVNANALRPYLGFAAIQQEQSNGKSSTTRCRSPGSARTQTTSAFGVSYTLSKSIGRQLQLPRHRSRHLQHKQPVRAIRVRCSPHGGCQLRLGPSLLP